MKDSLLKIKNGRLNKLTMIPNFLNDCLRSRHRSFYGSVAATAGFLLIKLPALNLVKYLLHRNIANMVVHTDVNLLSVLDFAVTHLKVKHVIVCGHYGCGGVKAAMTNHDYKYVLNMWLRNIKDVYSLYREELLAINDEEARFDRLVELNVIEQVMHLAKTSIIQRGWKNEQRPHLHGWVYGLKDGLIKPVFDMDAGTPIDPLYEYDDL